VAPLVIPPSVARLPHSRLRVGPATVDPQPADTRAKVRAASERGMGHRTAFVRAERRIRCGAPCGSQATASCRFVWQANGTAEGWRCDDQPSACGYSGGGAWAGGTLDGLRGVAMGACRCELTGVDRVLRVVTCRGGSVCQLCHVSTFRNSAELFQKKSLQHYFEFFLRFLSRPSERLTQVDTVDTTPMF
jgi:hypothetical protein